MFWADRDRTSDACDATAQAGSGAWYRIDALHHAAKLAIDESTNLLHRRESQPQTLEQQLLALQAVTQSTRRALMESRSAREGHYFKVVAKVEGAYLSIFDGHTQFCIGKCVERKPCAGRRGAFFVYRDLADAKRALRGVFPSQSKLIHAPRALLRVRSSERHVHTAHGKAMLWSLTPVAEVEVSTGASHTRPAQHSASIRRL